MSDESRGFFRVRWAACSNPFCDRFLHDRRVEYPIRAQLCRGCGREGTMRTVQWGGWPEAKRLRTQVKRSHAKRVEELRAQAERTFFT